MKRFVSSNREILAAVAFFIIVLIFVTVRNQPVMAPSADQAAINQPTPSLAITLDPRIIANVTNLPHATPLSGQDANELNGVLALVNACNEYSPDRRDQMVKQIGYIINPATLTSDIIIALGEDPRAKLLYALVEVTKNQWLLEKSPANSCLIPIGKSLNQLLTDAGGTPEPAFEGG